MKKKNRVQSYSRKTIIIALSLFVLLTMGVGYSTLGANLSFQGLIGVSKLKCQPDGTLYGVLECESKNLGLAKEYTGAHQDTMSGVGSQKIYHWYAENDSDGEAIQNKNNVIFADTCWQMIRTTDTGGVKLIYNGEPENNQCLDTRGNHLGTLGWGQYRSDTLYYFGTDYTYDPSTKKFTLSGTVQRASQFSNGILGLYSCYSDSNTSCSYLYQYISGPSSGWYNAIAIYSDRSHYSQFGVMSYDDMVSSYYPSAAFVGYMRGTDVHGPYHLSTTGQESVLSQGYTSMSYYYADEISYDSSTRKYSLVDPYQVTSEADFENLKGKYTFSNTSATASYSYVYYIAGSTKNNIYYISLRNGETIDPYYDTTYTYGDSYVDNGDGTYTISNGTTFARPDYFSNGSYVDIKGKYVCKNAVDDTCSNVMRVTSQGALRFDYYASSSKKIFSNHFTYDSETGMYTLGNDQVTLWDYSMEEVSQTIATHHYYCSEGTASCSTLYYTVYVSDQPNYIMLTNGQSIDDFLNGQLSNQVDSYLKMAVDIWYSHHFDATHYEQYLEDVIYCNNRSILQKNGWDANSGLLGSFISFKESNLTKDLSCERLEDRFSVSNNAAKLNYKVGIITSPELNLMNNPKARATGKAYWTMSPIDAHGAHDFGGILVSVDENGNLVRDGSGGSNGVRPVIALRPGVEYDSGGDGSKEHPYVVTSYH